MKLEAYWSELQLVTTQTPLNRRIYDETGQEMDEEADGNKVPDRGKMAEIVRREWFQNHVSRSENTIEE